MNDKEVSGENVNIKVKKNNLLINKEEVNCSISNILAIDIDDSLLPNPNCCSGVHKEIALEQFSINLRKINLLLETTRSKIFIISSWAARLDFDFKNKAVNDKNTKEDFYGEASVILKKYLNGNIIGISSGNKVRDIKMLEEKGYKVAIIDDTIFKDGPNSKFFETTGAVTNRICWGIERYFNYKENETNIQKQNS